MRLPGEVPPLEEVAGPLLEAQLQLLLAGTSHVDLLEFAERFAVYLTAILKAKGYPLAARALLVQMQREQREHAEKEAAKRAEAMPPRGGMAN